MKRLQKFSLWTAMIFILFGIGLMGVGLCLELFSILCQIGILQLEIIKFQEQKVLWKLTKGWRSWILS